MSDTHEVTKGSLGEVTNLHFTTVLSVRHARSDERVAWSGQEFAFCHSFEVTKGSLGQVKNLHFTTVLSVRHARSDERVARSGQEFAFYHSFERPIRTK